MDDRQKEIVKSLVQMAWADGRMSDEEEALLANVLVRMGCTQDEVVELKTRLETRPDMAHLETYLPDHASRLQAMKMLMAVSFADGALSSHEYEYIMSMARRLGVTGDELEDLREDALVLRDALSPEKT